MEKVKILIIICIVFLTSSCVKKHIQFSELKNAESIYFGRVVYHDRVISSDLKSYSGKKISGKMLICFDEKDLGKKVCDELDTKYLSPSVVEKSYRNELLAREVFFSIKSFSSDLYLEPIKIISWGREWEINNLKTKIKTNKNEINFLGDFNFFLVETKDKNLTDLKVEVKDLDSFSLYNVSKELFKNTNKKVTSSLIKLTR